MDGESEEKLLLVLNAIRIFLLPCAWLETICMRMLNIDTTTPFRMFPIHDPHPEYPACVANTSAFVMMLLIPYLVWSEARLKYWMPVGRLLRPLTRRCSRPVTWLVMFLRVWLYMALFNWHVIEILHNPFRCVFICMKISSLIFIL